MKWRESRHTASFSSKDATGKIELHYFDFSPSQGRFRNQAAALPLRGEALK
jgi:hypothetical protein